MNKVTPKGVTFQSLHKQKGFFILPGGMGAAKPLGFMHHRIYITANNGAADYTTMSEVELRATVGGADLTTTATVCTASSQIDGNRGPNNLVDNVSNKPAANHWVTGTGSAYPHWVAIQTSATPVVVKQFAIWPQATFLNRAPKNFVFQGSNNGGTSWVDIQTYTNITDWANNVAKLFIVDL